MSDRVNIKVAESTRDELRAHKREGETWDGLVLRAADALEASSQQYPNAPRCTDCGNVAHVWTIEDGLLVCALCAEEDLSDELPEVGEEVAKDIEATEQ